MRRSPSWLVARVMLSISSARIERENRHGFLTVSGRVLLARREHLLMQPGPGVSPVAVGGGARDAEGLGGLVDGQAGEVAELDQLGLGGGPRGELRPGPRPGPGGRRGSAGSRPAMSSRSTRGRAAAALRGCRLRRAFSTRMRRMASAAAAKKWPRLSQCCGLVRVHQPEVRLVDQGGGLERLLSVRRARAAQPPGLVRSWSRC